MAKQKREEAPGREWSLGPRSLLWGSIPTPARIRQVRAALQGRTPKLSAPRRGRPCCAAASSKGNFLHLL